MPDHYRSNAPMVPGFPSSSPTSDSPLSLVIGHRTPAIKVRNSPGRSSSGFSEEEEVRRPTPLKEQKDDDNDSGREGSPKPQSILRIKDFAKISEESVEEDKKFVSCEHCDKTFNNRYHYTSHLVTHTGERSFECPECFKSFGRKSTLRAHMTTHTKISNFMCHFCDKACNDNNSLEEHVRMHTGEKPFVCSVCFKAYARKSHLNVHYRVHTGERPFLCRNCSKDFTEKRFLNDHIQTAHSGQEGPLKCPNCSREFAYKTSLKQHLKKRMCVKNLNRTGNVSQGSPGTHSKQFSCPFCEKSYSWKQTLKQHVSMYHRNKVHTDEFWKYELGKHRKSSVDSKTNDDMWKKQISRHSSEQLQFEEEWNNPQDVKLMALQSLRSSLIRMNLPDESSSENYLSLLAHISAQRQAVEIETPDELASPTTPPLQEESSSQRTRMWLAQLGRYRSLQEEGERSHDELWEEQIAKIKKNPVKSPLEPLEITLDDDEDESPPKNAILPLMSELQVNKSEGEPTENEEIEEDEESVLKNILLDGRKRTVTEDTKTAQGSEDILRRRLLGMKDEPTPPKIEKPVGFSGGSVLKHLLHRYTSDIGG